MSSPPSPPSFQPQPQPQPQSPQKQQPPTPSHSQPQKLPILTNHCRFCNHLLLATTRQITTLPRRKPPAQDAALILPLPRAAEEEEDEELANENTHKPDKDAAKQPHYTILLSTTIPDRKPTVVRREDGFEKRLLLRCGRCRVVVGYFLDAVHFPAGGVKAVEKEEEDDDDGGNKGQRAKVVYLLPGALMETGVMEANDVEKLRAMDREWAGWMESS